MEKRARPGKPSKPIEQHVKKVLICMSPERFKKFEKHRGEIKRGQFISKLLDICIEKKIIK